ncbi:hypothetical protein CAPTEDRAFT_175959 [Capitella teleta]|uniref:Alkylglycerol monooxygenase n=1 Tax=Capitella teleta TaxID=283909 RepID=R7V9X6_CAPTE|nr:hypothetical protein CAPTEDRAFT_175959 [Capitella teleta]|eukprot:ELU13136.1 hypothetical protein CAPTEDRAFT_175959 [Capitella teleta]
MDNSTLDLTSEISTGVRSLFYAVPPVESSFKSIDEVPKYVDKAVPYFFVAIFMEAFIQLIRGRKDLIFRWNDAFSSLSAGVASQVPLLMVRNIEASAYIYVFEHYRIAELPWDSWVTWLLCMLGVDLGYYWVHRMAHEMNFMWAAHQVHHSSEDYNLNTALRQAVLQRYTSWVFYLPMALFIPPSQFLVHIQFNLLYQFWIHTNVVGKLGPLEWILNTASHHRVHHGRNRYCIDKNYAGVLIIWDRIFGTFVEEKDDEGISYGLVHPINSWDIFYIQLCHWQYMISTAMKTSGLGNKISIFLKGPGWAPGKPRLGYLEDIPDIQAPQPRYEKDLSLAMTFYVWTHFFIALMAQNFTALNRESLGSVHTLCSILFIMWTLTNIGFFYENKSHAGLSEFLRCATFLVADYFYCNTASCPQSLYIMRIIFFFSSLLSLYHIFNKPSAKKID